MKKTWSSHPCIKGKPTQYLSLGQTANMFPVIIFIYKKLDTYITHLVLIFFIFMNTTHMYLSTSLFHELLVTIFTYQMDNFNMPFQCFSSANCSRRSLHSNFSSSWFAWTTTLCLLRPSFLVNVPSHSSHSKLQPKFSPLWLVTRCLCNKSFMVNITSHSSQAKLWTRVRNKSF